MFSIWTTYPDRICYRLDGVALDSMEEWVLLGDPDGVDPDSHARSVSSGRGSLHLAHGEEFYPAGIPPHPDISHPDGKGGRSLCRHFTSGCEPCADILHPDIS